MYSRGKLIASLGYKQFEDQQTIIAHGENQQVNSNAMEPSERNLTLSSKYCSSYYFIECNNVYRKYEFFCFCRK